MRSTKAFYWIPLRLNTAMVPVPVTCHQTTKQVGLTGTPSCPPSHLEGAMPLLVSSAHPEAQFCKPLAALHMSSLTFYLTNGNDRISHLAHLTMYQNYEELSSLTCILFLLLWDQ